MSAIATAIVGSAVVGGVLSSSAQKSAASSAAGAQTAASDASIAEQQRQFDAMQKLLKPYTSAGEGALQAQQNLIGLGGQGAQQQAISALEKSPQYTEMVRQGENAILQNASATGGLRGGNVQSSLAQFRPQILSDLINQQYANLGGITQIGQASAAQQASAGMASANSISNLLGQQGAAAAGNYLAQGQANANLYSGIAGSIGTVAGMSKGSFGTF